MAATKGNSDMALISDSLVGQVRKEKKGKNSKKKEVLGSVTFGSADDFVDPKRQTESASVRAVGSGSTVLTNVPAGPGRTAVPFKFGQSNPFALPKAVTSASVVGAGGSYSLGTVERGAGYIGFGLTLAFPQGIPWGDTPYPGSLAAACLPINVEPANTSATQMPSVVTSSSAVQADSVLVDAKDLHPDQTSHQAPETPTMDDDPEKSLVLGTPQRLQEGLFQYGREGGLPPSTVDPLTFPNEELIDEETKPGLKRKPDKVRDLKKKLSRKKKEGAVNTLLLDHSSSGSDRTVIVSDTQREVTVAEDGTALDVPPTSELPLSVTCGPDSVVPGDRYSRAEYSLEHTGVCPWIHKLTDEFFKVYRKPLESLEHMDEFLKVISEVFVDLTGRLEQFESIKCCLEKLEAAQAKPSYSQVAGAPLFSVGVSGSGVSPSETLPVRRPPRVRNNRGRSSLNLEPEVVPPRAVLKAPSVSDPHRIQVPQQHNELVPERAKSKTLLKPLQESPTVLVSPLGDALNSSKELQSLLEAHISPSQLGLKVLVCLPAAENGVIIKLHTADMATILETHINGNPELNGVCRARAPRRPQPKILIYDVPTLAGDREEQEISFLGKLRSSNSFPEGSVSVLFSTAG
ncbi:hypothetical protein AVEN_206065-1 [Araneus ventricosus]|uniref:Uncharacterized protein n=1 Tax=Araneus ventricosus TaxID=182803 RepID=A0A4Y2TBD9_ARAVE|nr:hypothetical protein AVEN_98118-1 [Araneus ventricosus]GBN97543.1 hypothetical protein AVEN_109804-1 [Araneus ventricosus]GBN97551.1 hypothetical protein AVEN_98261-1 [Araneus ventricosus]GBN97848.1 hypothetical protein AVEN_206065-1 [Araneus ventricosus]